MTPKYGEEDVKFVHRYNPKHETLRRIAARMLKEAKLKMTRRTSTGCEYQAL